MSALALDSPRPEAIAPSLTSQKTRKFPRAPRTVAAALNLSHAEVAAGFVSLQSLQKVLPKNGIFEHELVVEDVPLPVSRAAFAKKPPAVILETGGGDGEPRNEPPPLDVLRLSESSCLLDVPPEESCSTFLYQVFPTFMLAGAGMVAAGLLLDIVQSWQVFIDVSQLFVLVPALLGLKGNLEMTLASRLSTQAHLGKMESLMEVLNLTCGNMALLQCQSLVVGAMASLYAIVTSLVVFSEDISLRHGILVLSSAIITVSVASLILGSIMVSVVVLSKFCRVNPDNVSISIAAALGDVVTVGLLACVSAAIFHLLDPWLSLLVSGPLMLLVPVWAYVAYKNLYTRDVLFSGWVPIICAMLISSLSGNILDVAIKKFTSMAAFQPLMNGMGGNLAAVHASRMSTLLHWQKSVQVEALNGGSSVSLSGGTVGETSSRSGYVLVALVVPAHLVFMNLISLAKNGTPITNVGFITLFCMAALLQVIALLLTTNVIVRALWRHKVDPDSSAIPYVTALGDLLGTGLLTLVFWAMSQLGTEI